MAAEITLPASRTRTVFRKQGSRVLSRKVLNAFVLGTIFLTAVLVLAAIKTYATYQDFAQLIDQQIATGYLRSHAGLYAAPRVIERGAHLSKEQLARDVWAKSSLGDLCFKKTG